MTYQEFENKCWPSLKEKLATIEPLRKKERKAWIKGTIVGVFVFGTIVGGVWYFAPISDRQSLDSIESIIVIPLIVSLLIGGGVYMKLKPKDYKKIYKEKVISNLLTHTKYQWRHILFNPTPKADGVDTRKAFLESGLYSLGINEDQLSFDADDIFYSASHNILMAEVHALTYTYNEGKRNRVPLFFGLFFRFDISHRFMG